MKLYPIIYTEGARTAEESLEKGIFAYLNPGMYPKVILVSGDRLLQAIESVKKKTGLEYNPSKDLDGNNRFFAQVENIAGKRAIVGSVSFHKDDSAKLNNSEKDLYKVDSSAGVASFGPLAYQIVMYVIQSSWLMSDESLKPASHRVWKNMYKLSEQGVYERKFLGEYSIDLIYERYIGTVPGKFMRYVESVENGTIPGNEENFLEWLRTKLPEEKPENFGQFWAYRKTSHDPKIKALFDKGNEFIQRLQTERNIQEPTDVARELITRSASSFFSRLYGSAASD